MTSFTLEFIFYPSLCSIDLRERWINAPHNTLLCWLKLDPIPWSREPCLDYKHTFLKLSKYRLLLLIVYIVAIIGLKGVGPYILGLCLTIGAWLEHKGRQKKITLNGNEFINKRKLKSYIDFINLYVFN